VVKAFNTVFAAHMADGQAQGERLSLFCAGDDPEAKQQVQGLGQDLGFDAVDAGPLAEGWRIQRDTPGYGPRRNAEELRQDLAAARRYAEM